MKRDKSLMELALEAYPPHKPQTSQQKQIQQKHASVSKSSNNCSNNHKVNLKPTSMEEWLQIFPHIEAKAEEYINPSRHQKVNNIKIERELDLHGYTWQEAQGAIDRFISYCQRNDIQAVRIIHGKGNRSKVEGGILREKVLKYLEQDKRIKKVSQAGYKEGQSGACNVVIKLTSIK